MKLCKNVIHEKQNKIVHVRVNEVYKLADENMSAACAYTLLDLPLEGPEQRMALSLMRLQVA